jgi:deazaflavin-dependent oxidoreductase (nitroreductase family)
MDPATKHSLIHPLQKHLFNHVPRTLLRLGVAPRWIALLETTGRKTFKPRRTPVGNGLAESGDTFWLISEHGRRSGYVRNIEANPRVRVKIGRHWRTGTAQLMPDDDPVQRQRGLPQANARAVRAVGTDLLTLRIDLDPDPDTDPDPGGPRENPNRHSEPRDDPVPRGSSGP